MLRPARTVRVRTKEELDAAFATADQITVEGDDALLSYAVSKASNDPENRISVEAGEHSIVVASAKPRWGIRDIAEYVGGGVLIVWLALRFLAPRPQLLSYRSFPSDSPPPAVSNGYAWPLVAIVAIVALFLIAWKAISSGSNVTITWKVTDKVAGKVVITKVRERTSQNRKAA